MVTKLQTTIGLLLLVLVIASGIIYISFGNKVRMRVDDDKTTFYVKLLNAEGVPAGRWRVSGREYVKLFDGSTLIRRHAKDVTIEEIPGEDDTFKIVRTTPYFNGGKRVDTYFFDGKLDDVELFPVYETVEFYDANSCGDRGCIFQWELRDLSYDGETREATSPESFGMRMKAMWQDGAYFAKIYQQLTSDKLLVKYRVKEDYVKFDLRFFDPKIKEPKIDPPVDPPVVDPKDPPVIPVDDDEEWVHGPNPIGGGIYVAPVVIPPGPTTWGNTFSFDHSWLNIDVIDYQNKEVIMNDVYFIDSKKAHKEVMDKHKGKTTFGYNFGKDMSNEIVTFNITSSNKLVRNDDVSMKYLEVLRYEQFDEANSIPIYGWKVLDFKDMQEKNPGATFNLTEKTKGKETYFQLTVSNVSDWDPIIEDVFTSALDGTYNQTEWYSQFNGVGIEHDVELSLDLRDDLVDYSMNNYTVTVSGTPTYNATGSFDGSGGYELNGDGDYFTVPETIDDNIETFTIAFHYRIVDKIDDYSYFYAKGSEFSRVLIKRDTGIITVNIFGLTDSGLATTVDTADGEWHHFATQYNGTHITLFIDGEGVSSDSSTGNVTTGTTPLTIGGYSTPGYYVNGSMANIKIFNRSITFAEIVELNNTDVPMIFKDDLEPDADLILFFDDDLVDDSLNNYDVTIENGNPTWITSGGHDDGGYYDFDGGNDRLLVGDNAEDFAFNGSDNFTFNFWVNMSPEDVTAYDAMFDKRVGKGYILIVRDGVPDFTVVDGTTRTCYDLTYAPAGMINDSIWHMVTMVHDNTYGRHIYVDGTLAKSCAGIFDFYSIDTNLSIGETYAGTLDYNGGIDDIQIIPRALTVAQIIALNNSNQQLISLWDGFFPRKSFYASQVNNWTNVTLNCAMYNNSFEVYSDCGDNVTVEVRDSSDNTTWDVWRKATTHTGDIFVFPDDITKPYFQYRLGLNEYENTTPMIFNVTIGYNGLGCTCPHETSQNWDVDMSLNCELQTNCNMSGYNITFAGAGTFTTNATLWTYMRHNFTNGMTWNREPNSIINWGET